MSGSNKERKQKGVSINLDGGDSIYRASVTALDISTYGATAEEALENIKRMAKLEVLGILEGRSGPQDDRRGVAGLILQRIVNRVDPFQIVNEPPPAQNGLK